MPLLRVDRTVRNLKRYRQIATVLAKYGFGHIVDRLDLRTRLRLRRKPTEPAAEPAAKLTLPVRIRRVLEELGPLVEPALGGDGQVVRHPAELLLNELELQVLAAIGSDATAIDDLVAATGLSPAQILSTLSVLEMRHVIRRLSGVLVARI